MTNSDGAPREFNIVATFVLLVILAGLGFSTYIIIKGKSHPAEKSVQSGSGR
jgi:hypothetical protein